MLIVVIVALPPCPVWSVQLVIAELEDYKDLSNLVLGFGFESWLRAIDRPARD